MNHDPTVIQSALTGLARWAEQSQMRIQPTKCAVLYLGNNNPKSYYYFQQQIVPATDIVIDLGVIMNSTLTFDNHIESTIRKATMASNLILRIFKKNHSFMMQMFKTYVRSRLEYATQIWNPHKIGLIQRIENVQRRFTRKLPLLKNMSYPNRLYLLNTDSLELRRIHLDLIFLYKLLHKKFDFDPMEIFAFKNDKRTRGNSWSLVGKRSRLDKHKYFFTQRMVNIWNSLPEETVSAQTISEFKKLIKAIDFGLFLRGRGLDV